MNSTSTQPFKLNYLKQLLLQISHIMSLEFCYTVLAHRVLLSEENAMADISGKDENAFSSSIDKNS